MTIATSVRIPTESSVLTGHLQVPADARGLIVVASAGVFDSWATGPNRVEAELLRRRYGTLSVSLLTMAEEERDKATGRFHLDVSLLADRMCRVLGAIRCHPDCRKLECGMFVDGMAAAGAVVSASHHSEVRAIVSWNGRADLVGADALRTVSAPVLFLTTPVEPHLVDLNHKAAAMLGGVSTLDVVDVLGPGINRDRLLAARAADWFDGFIGTDGESDRRLAPAASINTT